MNTLAFHVMHIAATGRVGGRTNTALWASSRLSGTDL